MSRQKSDRRIITAPKNTNSFGYELWKFLDLEHNDASLVAEALLTHINLLSSIIHGTKTISKETVDNKGWRDALRNLHPERWDNFYPVFDAFVESLQALPDNIKPSKKSPRLEVADLLDRLMKKKGEDVYKGMVELANSVSAEDMNQVELQQVETWRNIRCGTKMPWGIYAAALDTIIRHCDKVVGADAIKALAIRKKPVLAELAESEKNSPDSTEKPGRPRKSSDRSQAPTILWSSSSCVVD